MPQTTTATASDPALGRDPHEFPTPYKLTVGADYPFVREKRLGLRHFLCGCVCALFWPYFRLAYRFRVYGRENLAALSGGAVTVSNHVSAIDCVMLASAVWPRDLWYLSLKSNFEIPVIRHLVRALGALPIPDTVGGYRALENAIAGLIRRGALFQVYPEGSLRPECQILRPFERGAFAAAAGSGVPVLPCVIKIRRSARGRKRVQVCLLPAVVPDPALPRRRRIEDLEQKARAAMEAELVRP